MSIGKSLPHIRSGVHYFRCGAIALSAIVGATFSCTSHAQTSVSESSSSNGGPMVCCHVGLYSVSILDVSPVTERVTAQGKYKLISAKPGTLPKQYQKVCEDSAQSLLSSIWDEYKDNLPLDPNAELPASLDPLPVNDYSREFLSQVVDFRRIWGDKDKTWVAQNLNKPITLSGLSTSTVIVKTADPAMCTRRWCGVKGVLSDEANISRGRIVDRKIIEEERPDYKYYHISIEAPAQSTASWIKTTAFKFPVQRIDDSQSCECKAMTQSYPPSHSGLVDAVLPSRDWIAPPTTSQTLLSDGKYSRNLCPDE